MKVILTHNAKVRMRAYVMSVTTEISGLGKAYYDKKEEAWYVTDIKIFNQEVSGTETELDGQELARFVTQLVKDGESPADWCVWWHSHANMGVFWSGTDTKTMEEWNTGRYLLSIVTNRKDEFRARFDLHDSMIHSFKDNLEVEYEYEEDDRIKALREQIEAIEEANLETLKTEVNADVEAKVKKKVYAPPVRYTYPNYYPNSSYYPTQGAYAGTGKKKDDEVETKKGIVSEIDDEANEIALSESEGSIKEWIDYFRDTDDFDQIEIYKRALEIKKSQLL